MKKNKQILMLAVAFVFISHLSAGVNARHLVSIGCLTASIVHPREVFAPAIEARAASILCLHNHPSGDPSPSPEDIEITHRLKQTGELVGIRLMDHIIIAKDGYVSFTDKGLL